MNQAAKRGVRTLLIFQLGLMIIMAIIGSLMYGWKAFYSAFLAGGCSILPMAVFAAMVFRRSGAQNARIIARLFYRGEAVKWLITAILMILIFIFISISPGIFFTTFCVMQLSYWIALVRISGLFKS